MGAWAEDAFGNDAACDWAGDFSENPSLDAVREAIDRVLEANDYLESDTASECLVACEVLARLKGQWGLKNAYSEAIDQWVESVNIVPPPDLITLATKAIARILGDNSELQALWDEDGKNEKWHLEMDNLLRRVSR
ncbi:DUF4259 domain-containing protein [Synechocystis sp. LKSZ1]|uniref:DUF4259 domain-containing protein n=1 Tax=Synechocystis sp. LKSZ1 TaxID=3144951 RepID=UPI00336C106E